MDITVEHDLAVAAAAALRQAGEHDRAVVIERRLNPPEVFVLTFGENEDGYDLYLVESAIRDGRYVMPDIDDETLSEIEAGELTLRDLFDDEADTFGFETAGVNTALFPEQQSATFDLSSLPPFMRAAEFVIAPSGHDGLVAYESGNTELYLCDGLIACGQRADKLRYEA